MTTKSPLKQPTQQVRIKNPKGNPNIAELGKATRWKKGEPSPNPAGSPKKPQSITMHLRDELAKVGPNGKTKAQEIAEGMVEAALTPVAAAGSSKVLGEVLDRTEGKVTQPIGGDKDKPLLIHVIYDEKETDKGDSE